MRKIMRYLGCIKLLSIMTSFIGFTLSEETFAFWRWVCEDGKCVRYPLRKKDYDSAFCLEACQMFCNKYGTLWPRPTGSIVLGNHLSKINVNTIDFQIIKNGRSNDLLLAAVQRFKQIILSSIPRAHTKRYSGKMVIIYFINASPHISMFSLPLDENYSLRVTSMSDETVNVTIIANNFFGLRHGLETLSQLIIYDDIRDHVLMVRDVSISDSPVYSYRGIMLDTARNFYSVDAIKSTIDAMAAVKLNTFHWHITDSQSFPLFSERRPRLTKHGAYGPNKIYMPNDIRGIVKYALERGVRVLPEIDAPAHVGEGWQDTGLIMCYKKEPWALYCVEPPCGQLNPAREELYEVLQDIYKDIAELFQPDMFHMGGDEANQNCWNSSCEVQHFVKRNRWALDTHGFLKLWYYFQLRAQDKAYQAFRKRLPLIVRSSTMTSHSSVSKYLSKDDYIIQVWTTLSDPEVKTLLDKGYRLIISNYDALYLDCGFGAWIGGGNNWCSPYKGWQTIYDNTLGKMAEKYINQILGAEVVLWSEQSDEASLATRLWPRSAALAERLWAEPKSIWLDAEHRMLNMRERLIRMGIQADSIEPEWCYQNNGKCNK